MRALSFLTLILAFLPASQSLAGTIIVGRTDARECYLATLAESSPAGDRRGLDACDRAANADNGDAYAHAAILVNRADIRLRMRDYTGTLTDANASIALEPDLAAAYLNRGAGLIGLQRYQEALPALEKVIALNPNDRLELAYFNRGIAREHLGDIRGAYHDYKQAQELNPKFEPAKEQLTRFTVTIGSR
ncbi:MAG: tetratricopeptide repeat protein [Pseudomonadota bacterium]